MILEDRPHVSALAFGDVRWTSSQDIGFVRDVAASPICPLLWEILRDVSRRRTPRSSESLARGRVLPWDVFIFLMAWRWN